MPIPEKTTLRFAILRLLADGREHHSEEILERMTVQFNVTSSELSPKLRNGKTPLQNEIDLALANLQGAPSGSKLIDKIGDQIYRINETGKDMI